MNVALHEHAEWQAVQGELARTQAAIAQVEEELDALGGVGEWAGSDQANARKEKLDAAALALLSGAEPEAIPTMQSLAERRSELRQRRRLLARAEELGRQRAEKTREQISKKIVEPLREPYRQLVKENVHAAVGLARSNAKIRAFLRELEDGGLMFTGTLRPMEFAAYSV